MTKIRQRTRPEPDREPRTQYAALPWRRTPEGAVEVLLVTSRETRRWVIPKGWPIKKLKPAAAAAQEAFEEAGLSGTMGKAVGDYHYDKRLRSGRTQHVRVRVFPLLVAEEHPAWPEMDQRERRWTAPAHAAELVDEPELKLLIAAFNPNG